MTRRRGAAEGRTGGRPPAFGKDAYKQRNVVETLLQPAKRCASLVLIAALIWPT